MTPLLRWLIKYGIDIIGFIALAMLALYGLMVGFAVGVPA